MNMILAPGKMWWIWCWLRTIGSLHFSCPANVVHRLMSKE